MYMYCWCGNDGDEFNVNLSSPERFLHDFEKEIVKLKLGQCLSINTKRLPEGSPHHIDNKKEIVEEHRREFDSVRVVITEEKQQEITVSINDGCLVLDIPVYVKEYFLESFLHTLESAYFYDNSVPIIMLNDNGEILNGKLYFWATDGNDVIFC